MGYKLLTLDMDGTLLTSDKKVSPATRAALEQVAAQGVALAYSTGRNALELSDYLHELPFIRYGLLSSGAVVYDFEDQKALSAKPIQTETLLTIMETASLEKTMLHVMTAHDSVVRPDDIPRMPQFCMGPYQDMFERICTRETNLVAWAQAHPGEVIKLNCYHQNVESRARTRARLTEMGLPLELVDSEGSSLECTARGASKGEGIRILAKHLGITVDEAVAIGDSDNDIAALTVAGMPVAMGNATDSVMSLAHMVVADNDHDGIAEAVERLF
ncbi:MAG: Cof-type HAD-IIB family hydrolase [Coriobacteriales bacterium]|nr:Cof-type HAD-IIB family hydrolase [Coriobacteriales bacterium]